MVLVTGATGFIGSHFVERLCALGEEVRCLLRPRRSPPRLPAGVQIAHADLAGGDGIAEALDGVATVVHLAGVTKALKPADYYDGNARATETLARAMAGRGIHMVHVSSLAAIGPGLGSEPVEEDAEPHPVSTYGKSKLEAERIVHSLLPDAIILRPSVVYGPRDTDVFRLLKSISQGIVLQIAGPERRFSSIYVRDVAEGLIAAIRSPRAAGRAYFLAYPKAATWSELSATAARIMGRSPRVLRIPPAIAGAVGYCAEIWARARSKPGIISREKIAEAQYLNWTCDTRRASADLGFEAATPLATGLAETLAWYKEAGWLKY
jgi:nucleoside-diphosphate-sugar epimerase